MTRFGVMKHCVSRDRYAVAAGVQGRLRRLLASADVVDRVLRGFIVIAEDGRLTIDDLDAVLELTRLAAETGRWAELLRLAEAAESVLGRHTVSRSGPRSSTEPRRGCAGPGRRRTVRCAPSGAPAHFPACAGKAAPTVAQQRHSGGGLRTGSSCPGVRGRGRGHRGRGEPRHTTTGTGDGDRDDGDRTRPTPSRWAAGRSPRPRRRRRRFTETETETETETVTESPVG